MANERRISSRGKCIYRGKWEYFARRLKVYGRERQPRERCGRAIKREAFANRSSYRCPGCQRLRRK
ncbi:zinc finger domain-containing protein [Gulosibacter sp. 10]|uniref:zinc finger domain-containing protein n=1 Tax=Gulosibacter sp. 10 TaxID=1255570 RepID=UPI00097F1250|nr:zinc finger domain-containing protein [Gulosibacter sp. 10]SJM62203.1 Formamidopyrimidine-DNA glycosylase [Gulosibacter sp. 10]